MYDQPYQRPLRNPYKLHQFIYCSPFHLIKSQRIKNQFCSAKLILKIILILKKNKKQQYRILIIDLIIKYLFMTKLFLLFNLFPSIIYYLL